MTKATMKYICRSLMGALGAILWMGSVALSATLLPPGKNCFYDASGASLSAGTVEFYVPNTMSPKDTWQNADQSTLNTNPVALDAAGCALIYGNGTYRQILKDANGVTIWDQPTSTGASISANWGGTSGGSANAQTVSLDAFDLTDGQVVNFLAGFTNTTAMTLNVNSTGPIPVVRDSGTGPVILTGGEIVVGNAVSVLYSEATGQFHILTPTPITSLDGAVFFSGVLTPTILASDQNDWTPAGTYTAASTLRVSSNTAITITGLTGGAPGRTLFFHNVGSFAITLSPNNSASAAANRFGFTSPIILSPNDSITIQYDSVSSLWRNVSPATATFPPGFLYGCTLSNNASDPANDIDFSPCLTAASNASVDQRGTAMTKRIDDVWSAGTNQGMRSSASLADTTWHIFAISKTDGTTDYFAHNDLDPTSVLPSGYPYYRRIGSIIRASSANLGFVQFGDDFYLKVPILTVNNVSQTTTAALRAMDVPNGLNVKAYMNARTSIQNAAGQLYMSSPDTTDTVATTALGSVTAGGSSDGGTNTIGQSGAQVSVWTNTSRQIRTVTNATMNIFISTIGWMDRRGKD